MVSNTNLRHYTEVVKAMARLVIESIRGYYERQVLEPSVGRCKLDPVLKAPGSKVQPIAD